MPDRIGVFMRAALVPVSVPGPDVLYITARAIDQGRLAGMVSALSAARGGLVLPRLPHWDYQGSWRQSRPSAHR